MNKELTPKEMAGKLGVNPEKADFELDEKEIHRIAGGAGPYCGEIGVSSPESTKTGLPGPCDKIGHPGSDCSKTGF
jgi:hypothetical protein